MKKLLLLSLLFTACNPTPQEKIKLDLSEIKIYKNKCDSLTDVLYQKDASLSFKYQEAMYYDDVANNGLFFPYTQVQDLLIYDSAKGKLYDAMNTSLMMIQLFRQDFFKDVVGLQGDERDKAYSDFKKIWPPLIDTSALMMPDAKF